MRCATERNQMENDIHPGEFYEVKKDMLDSCPMGAKLLMLSYGLSPNLKCHDWLYWKVAVWRKGDAFTHPVTNQVTWAGSSIVHLTIEEIHLISEKLTSLAELFNCRDVVRTAVYAKPPRLPRG